MIPTGIDAAWGYVIIVPAIASVIALVAITVVGFWLCHKRQITQDDRSVVQHPPKEADEAN